MNLQRIALLLSGILMLVVMSCKKSDNSSSGNNLAPGSCRVISEEEILATDTLSATYEYDNEGKMFKETSDMSGLPMITYYIYTGDRFSYSFSGIDTTYYYYDGIGRLYRYQYVEHVNPYMQPIRQDHLFAFDANNRVYREEIFILSDTISIKLDSILFEYTGDNVTKARQYSWSGSGWLLSETDFTYDSMKNYVKATGIPPISVFTWSANNMKTYTTNGVLIMKNEYPEYNANGYPTLVTYTYLQDTIPVPCHVSYECN
ncbi:MAG TPA: hypothetical protein VMC08_11190 [Bacteroidales bacterium]|nr:hypothetical protein [Bacteroidales bacterium]